MDTLTFILFLLGFVLLIAGAEVLVRGASRLAVAAGISPLVVGLTVVAYGTSAPELAVTIQASFAGQSDIAIGNVVGSNISNILLVLGISAAVAPLSIAQQLIRWDIPIMIGLSGLMLLMGLDGVIGRVDGIVLFTGAIIYTVIVLRQSRKAQTGKQRESADFGGARNLSRQITYIVIGLILLVFGARWLVNGAVEMARLLGVNELIVGLTIVAVGTSLPEIATSIIAGLRGQRAIAVGNAVGSNIFNILLVLGVCSIVAPGGIPVSSPALHFDIPVMIAVAVACLPIFFIGYQIARWEGFLFLGYYLAYSIYLYLNATQHDALEQFSLVMISFVMPMTLITLVVLVARDVRANNRRRTASK
jgi:cation:H+ antiporter